MTIDDNNVDEGELIFEKGMYLPFFLVNDTSVEILEYKSMEEEDTNIDLEKRFIFGLQGEALEGCYWR